MPKEDTSRRRLGLATSGAVAAVAFTAVVAVGANVGLFGFARHSERAATVPSLTAGAPEQPEPTVPVAPVVETRFVDVPVQLPAAEEGSAPAVADETPVEPVPVAVDVAPSPGTAPVVDDDTDDIEDHEDEDDDEEEDLDEQEDHEDEDHPVEVEDHEDEHEDE